MLTESPTKQSVFLDSGVASYHPLFSDKQFSKGSSSAIKKIDATVQSEKGDIPQTERNPEVHQGTKRASNDEEDKNDNPNASSPKKIKFADDLPDDDEPLNDDEIASFFAEDV